MPEPIAIIQTQRQRPQRPQRHLFESQLNSTLFNLRRSTEYIYDGVEYKFDFDEYNIRTDRARYHYHMAQNDYDNQLITKQILDDIADQYFNDICTYYLIDVDGKECGTFNTYTREYYIYLRRIQIDDVIYYADNCNVLQNYRGIFVARLLDDGTVTNI
jgi:hypothetical protein